MSADMPRLVIGTHHKSGTVLMRNIVVDVAKEMGMAAWIRGDDAEPDHWDIYLDFWSIWQTDLDDLDFGGVHIIRRPEALIYSAALYHLRGSEEWLDNKWFDGKSYVEKLRELGPEEQLIFEMNQSSKKVLARLDEVAQDPRFVQLKVEDISHQRSMSAFSSAFLEAGVPADRLGEMLAIAKRHCLWFLNDNGVDLAHSTTGMGEAWRDAFTPPVQAEFDKIYGDLAQRLGYQ